jgi:hypothetical protein
MSLTSGGRKKRGSHTQNNIHKMQVQKHMVSLRTGGHFHVA